MKLEKRIQALEGERLTALAVLQLADGSTWELRGSAHWLLDLLVAASSPDELSSEQARQLELIRQAIHFQESSGGA